MNEKEKARPAGCTTGQAAGNAALGGATIPNVDFTTNANETQAGKIFNLLLAGASNAISAASLARLAGYRDTRSLRAAIDRERSLGQWILADDSGYYRPAPGLQGIYEARRFLARQDARCRSNRRTTATLRRQLRELERMELDGQETLFEGKDNE